MDAATLSAAAVGLGNLWRFAYLVGEYGGAPFVVAYVMCLLLVAVPVLVAEVAGQQLVVVEAMKMENVLNAERDGKVAKLLAEQGDTLAVDQPILEFE